MKKTAFDSGIAVIGAGAAYLFGELHGVLFALIALTILDYITGVITAVAKKKLSSEIGFKGICKKILMFAVVAVANIIDVEIIAAGGVLRSAVICFFIANEGLSILENAAKIGLPVPKKLLDILEQLKNNKEKQEENSNGK